MNRYYQFETCKKFEYYLLLLPKLISGEIQIENDEWRSALRPAPSRWDESPFGNGTRVPSGNV
ncbi:MAG: hypothetical protein KJ963_07105 [Bacteroidetes bacterium]|nr:hypothetical protein [Bacteroidota bacterium]MBU2636835.1 hypothetical protein [Bacteroidota bacterium]